jgi:hypothetical protein
VTTASTKHRNAFRSVLGLFAIAFALLVPVQGRAQQGEVKSLINYYTGTALSNGGSTAEGTPLFTSIWIFGPYTVRGVWTQQQWQFFSAPGIIPNPQRISSLSSYKVMDVLAHSVSPLFLLVQAAALPIDNSTPWKFQTWSVMRSFLPGYFTLMNGGSGMCLTDFGNIGTGGAAVQQPCDSNPRQLWRIWNHNKGIWE